MLPAEPVAYSAAHNEVAVLSLQPRQFFGKHRHAFAVAARHARDVGGPEPVEAAGGPPALLLRLIEGEAEAEHAGPLPPVAHDLLAVWRLQIEMSEDAEFVGVRLDRLDGELVDLLAQGRRRMDNRGI